MRPQSDSFFLGLFTGLRVETELVSCLS